MFNSNSSNFSFLIKVKCNQFAALIFKIRFARNFCALESSYNLGQGCRLALNCLPYMKWFSYFLTSL
jgi:hypothetical protein